MNQRINASNKKSGWNFVAIQDFKQSRRAGLRAVIGSRKRRRLGVAIAQQKGLGVVVEGEQHGHTGAVGPGIRSQPRSHRYGIHRVEQLLIRPVRSWLRGSLGGMSGRLLSAKPRTSSKNGDAKE